MQDTSELARERSWLRCEDWIERDLGRLGTEQWITVYRQENQENSSLGVFSALIPVDVVDRVLESANWDASIGFGLPCEITSSRHGQECRRYERYGNNEGQEPLVLIREFGGIYPDQVEIAEEFRHYFNLRDTGSGVFVWIDRAGDEEEVVRLNQQHVDVHLRFLKEFLAAKQMILALYFDLRRYSELPLEQAGASDSTVRDATRLLSYEYYAAPWVGSSRERFKSFGRLFGKRLVMGSPKVEPEEVFEEFIIGTDGDGRPVLHTCDQHRLSNYFGANPGSPHYLTPVFFRRDVLNKYYESPRKYAVRDGHLSCGHLWGVQIDNNHEKYVTVYLGDLGRDMPPRERLYWKSYNVPPEGGTSDVNFRRSILAEFTSPAMKDLLFKERLERFQNDWHRQHGWDLFKPLAAADQHYLGALRIPLANTQSQFDEQVLALAKILIDSINESEITKRIPTQPPDTRSIKKFEAFLTSQNVDGYAHATFLQNLWKLRHGSPHRKGSEYEKAATRFQVEELGFVNAFTTILEQAIAMLEFLRQHLLGQDGEIGGPGDE